MKWSTHYAREFTEYQMNKRVVDRAQAAIRAAASESSSLDYKAAWYEETEGGRKEFAKDISAFANKSGGLLIIGVKEANGLPVEIPGVPGDTVDRKLLWLESVARTGMAPHLPGIAFVAFEMDGKQLVAVDVPRGADLPYEVPVAGARFFVREERSVRTMSREEIKFAVRREADINQRIAAFCDERWRALRGHTSGESKALQQGQGACQLIVFPVFEGSFEHRFDIPSIKSRFPSYPEFNRREIYNPRATLDGLEYRKSDLNDGKLQGFARLFRHGAIQVADGYIMDFREGERGPRPHPGSALMDGLLNSIKHGVETCQSVTGAETFLIDFRILTRIGYHIAFFHDPFGDRAGVADRDELLFDAHVLNIEEGWVQNVPAHCKPLLDQVWQAFGFDDCRYFDEAGQYAKP